MTSTTPRIITIALAILALAAPVAAAAPIRDGSPPLAAPTPPARVYVIPDGLFKQPLPATAPAHDAKPAVSGDSDTSALVYILPSLALIAMFGAAAVFVRASRQPAQV
jgi:hypothetical protein